MLVAQLLKGVAPGNLLGSVTNIDGPIVTIVCRKLEGVWTPLYGLKHRQDEQPERIPLPPCFQLDQDALDALAAVEAENRGETGG